MDAQTPKTAIVYYSRSGHSERLAGKLAEALHGTLVPLEAPGYDTPILGYLRAGYDSLRGNTSLAPQRFDSLADFDLLVLCGPVWTSSPAVPLRALLRSEIALPKAVALFLTSGDRKPAVKAWHRAADDLGRSFVATGSLSNAAEGSAEETTLLDEFLAQLQTRTPAPAAV